MLIDFTNTLNLAVHTHSELVLSTENAVLNCANRNRLKLLLYDDTTKFLGFTLEFKIGLALSRGLSSCTLIDHLHVVLYFGHTALA